MRATIEGRASNRYAITLHDIISFRPHGEVNAVASATAFESREPALDLIETAAEVVDTIEPVGCIMAGDWQRNAPWRKGKSRLVAADDLANTASLVSRTGLL